MSDKKILDLDGLTYYDQKLKEFVGDNYTKPDGNYPNMSVGKADKAEQDIDGNNIPGTYAKQNGTYSGMTVGNATNADKDSNGNIIVDTYATKNDFSNTVKKTGETSQTIAGDVAIQGNLTVSGETTTLDTQTLLVKDNLIVTNSAGATITDLSGLSIKIDGTNVYGILYDPATNSVKLGKGTIDSNGKFTFSLNEGYPVTTRSEDSDMTDEDLVQWDATDKKIVDSGKKISDIALKTETLKTYNSISQLGLSYPCTTLDIMNAMEAKTFFMTNVEAKAQSVTDVFADYGVLMIWRMSSGNRIEVTYQRTLSNDHTQYEGIWTYDSSTKKFNSIAWKPFAYQDGNYPSMIVGKSTKSESIVSTKLTNQNLNTYIGENYFGKSYYAGGDNTITNKPNGVASFGLYIVRSGDGLATQILVSSNASGGSTSSPTIYQRWYNGSTFTNWEEIVTSDGTYPNMSVGKATKSIESNNNLFYNGDFKLNTQGKSEYTETGSLTIETVDGWAISYGDSTLSVLSNGVKITKLDSTTTATNFGYYAPLNIFPKAGKYTISFAVDDVSSTVVQQIYASMTKTDGTVIYFDRTFVRDSINGIFYSIITVTDEQYGYISSGDVTKIGIGIQKHADAESLTIYWAKLEEGDTCTGPNGLVQNATRALYSNKAAQDIDGNNIPDTYAKQNGEYPNMTVGGLSYSKFGATSTGEYTDCYVEICNVAFKTNWGNASIILLVNGYMPYTTQRSGIIEIDVRAASNVWTVKLAKVLSGNLEADRLSIYSDENNVIHVYLHVQKEVFAITKLSALYDGVNITYPNTIISTLPDGVILGNNVNIARYDSDGNIISDVYAKQNGFYPNISVGNAGNALNDGQGNDIVNTYATKTENNAKQDKVLIPVASRKILQADVQKLYNAYKTGGSVCLYMEDSSINQIVYINNITAYTNSSAIIISMEMMQPSGHDTTTTIASSRIMLSATFDGTNVTSDATILVMDDSYTHTGYLNTTNTTSQATSSNEKLSGWDSSPTINLHKVSKTGSYNDLLNKPSPVQYVLQSLTTDQKTQARTNIGAASTDDITKITTGVTKVGSAVSADSATNATNAVTAQNYNAAGGTIKDKFESIDTEISNIKNEISTQYIRITDLDSGVYKLTYNGTKYIYYNGSSSTSTTTVDGSLGTVMLVVNKYKSTSSEYWTWYYINNSGGTTTYLHYGTTYSTSGNYNKVALPSATSGTLALTTAATISANGLMSSSDKIKLNNLANPNLLINPNFKINQRGSSSYTSIGYTVDRWYKNTSSGTIYPWSSGLDIYSTSSVTQYLENNLQLGTTFRFTVTYRYSSETATLSTIYVSATTPTTTPTSSTTIASNTSGTAISIYVGYKNGKGYYVKITGKNSSVHHYIESAQLEIGSISTPFVIPDPATELNKCQRYYYKTPSGYGFDIPISKVNTSTTDRRGNVFFPVTMRKAPTISNVTTEQSGITIIKQFINANGFLAGVNGYTGTDQGPVITAYTADAEI